jgi:hypothetical protein
MIRRLLTLPYRTWLRLDLAWVNDRIADELQRQANHDATIRVLRAEAAHIRWQLDARPSRKYGLEALRDRRRPTA